MRQMLYGATAMGSLVVGLFFLRFYMLRRDTLFAYFGVAFWLLALNNIALGLNTAAVETRVHWYIVRLVAFVLIIVGIVAKNRASN